MKLRNKKTGFVTDWCIDKDVIRTCDGSIVYNSIAELNEDWEDYEEPKTDFYFYIDDYGCVQEDYTLCRGLKMRKEIGNYFKTEEEAEKAVEKLKAWKRLKDAGFTFNNKSITDIEIGFIACGKDYDRSREDLDLLFGGEE